MTSFDDLAALSSAASLYILPIGPVAAAYGALRLGGSGLGFAGARLIIRDGKSRVFDWPFFGNDLPAAIADLPAALQEQAKSRIAALTAPRTMMPLSPGKHLAFTRPRLFGVLNVTPDSFSDGGQFLDTAKAIEHGLAMHSAGADVIDVGGESTRPGAAPVWEGDEMDRVLPVIEALSKEGALVSIDTRHSTVMTAAVKAGAHIINDVSGLTYDGHSPKAAAEADVPVVLMHAKGTPKTMQDAPIYDDVLLDVFDELEARMVSAVNAGVKESHLIADPGIGFGKAVVKDNLALLNAIPLFHTLGCPLLVGASRKRFIGAISGVETAEDRMPGSISVAAHMVARGAQILRVHDVAETRQAVALSEAFIDAESVEAAAAMDQFS